MEDRFKEANRKYKSTKKGVIATMYAAQLYRSKKRGWPRPTYTLKDIRDRLLGEPHFHYLYREWVSKGRKKEDKPSLDRIDPTKPYTMGNIRITSWKQNREKGDKEKILITRTEVDLFDLQGNLIKRFASITEASRETGIGQSTIIFNCKNKSKKPRSGKVWRYAGRFRAKMTYENPELIKE